MEMILSQEAIDRYRTWLTESGRSTETARAYCGDLEVFLSTTPLRQASKQSIEQHGMAWLTQQRSIVSPRTTGRRLSSLRGFASWAGWGVILKDYRAPRPGSAVPHPLPDRLNDVWRLIDQAKNSSDVAIIALCALVGCRVGEARSITPDSIDLPNMQITVRGKGDKTRVLPLSSRAWEMITPAYNWAVTQGGVALVPGSDSAVRKRITSMGKAAGIDRAISSHDLRSTFGSVMYDKTLNLRLVQELMGHANSTTTEVYTQVKMSDMRDAVAV